MKNVLEFIENSAKSFPDKTVIGEELKKTDYGSFCNNIKALGSAVLKYDVFKKPVIVLTDKNAKCLELAFSAVAAGGFYTIIDNKMPADRIEKIFTKLMPQIILTDRDNFEKAQQLSFSGEVIVYEDIINTKVNEAELLKVRQRQIDTDILYILFTSGSTGNPKGVVINHKSVIEYTNWVTEEFKFDEETVFGSQTPFYFSMSVTDIFSTVKCGAVLEIIPKHNFSFPVHLINYLNDLKINTVYWVPSALSIVANFKTFEAVKPQHLRNILFAGEVMPTKQLNYWINSLGNEKVYANLFGPTETTDICTFYRVNRRFENDESIPIGIHCDNCDVMIVTDDGKEGASGELYARGSFLANGYYNDKEKTDAAFVQNPLQNAYPEIVYKTGDLVKVNEYGEIEYVSRRDFQIKHMGYRIELGEIENSLNAVESIKSCVCIYDKEEDKIVLIFEGKKQSESELIEKAGAALPAYMRPNIYKRVKLMPINQNGKTDRSFLTQNYKNI